MIAGPVSYPQPDPTRLGEKANGLRTKNASPIDSGSHINDEAEGFMRVSDSPNHHAPYGKPRGIHTPEPDTGPN